MSSESSPSKLLCEGLDGFHISSPSKFKSYVENNEFQDTEFDSQVRHSKRGKNYVNKLDNWSVNYGTVQQHGVNNENEDLPQWKQHLRNQATAPKEVSSLLQPRDNLVVTSSLSDISLIPTNTFKNRVPRPLVDDTPPIDGNDRSTATQDADIDPAREALGVFNNVLRHQRSNFFNGDAQGAQSPERSVSDGYETGSNSSYDSFDPSLSPSLRQSNKKQSPGSRNLQPNVSPRRPLKLITPEDAGMVFNYKEGVWDQPSAAVDASTSGAQDESSQSKIVSFKLPRTRPEQSVIDDTPLSTPKMDQRFMSRSQSTEFSEINSNTARSSATASRKNSLLPADTTNNLVANVTSVSELNTSFRIARGAVVSALVDVIPRKEIWEHVQELSLENRALESLVGLNEMVPGLLELDVSHNKLNSLQGVPQKVISLCCSHNKIGSYCRLDVFEHLENVDMSHNTLSTNLSLLAGCLHLREVNISQNRITSLQGLSESHAHVEVLNVSRNRLIGPLDFAELMPPTNKRNFLMHLRELDLSGNKITSIKNLHLLKSLRILKLDGNPLESLEGNHSTSLRTLTALGCTALTHLGDFSQLRILKLSGESFRIDWLPETLEQFELTGIAGTPSLATVPWEQLPHMLRKLRLSRLGIEDVPGELAARCPALDTLVLTDNELRSTARLLERLPQNLRVLDVRRNPLAHFHQEADRKTMIEAIALVFPTLKRLFL